MFSALILKEKLNASPFRPFRIMMTDGRHFDVTNHDAALVKRHAIEIGLDADPNGIAERFVECAIIHITSIEELIAA